MEVCWRDVPLLSVAGFCQSTKFLNFTIPTGKVYIESFLNRRGSLNLVDFATLANEWLFNRMP